MVRSKSSRLGQLRLADSEFDFNQLDFKSMTRVLMVCMGNICRSPMAVAVARHMLREARFSGTGLSDQVVFDSAGTHSRHLGEYPDTRAKVALLRRGYEPTHSRSRRVIQHDFNHFDLILAMDRANLTELQRICPPPYSGKLRLFLDFAEGLRETEVPDPYYGNMDGFERVLDLCEAGARGLIKTLASTAR